MSRPPSPQNGGSAGCVSKKGYQIWKQLRMYTVSSRGQLTRVGPPTWDSDEVLRYETEHTASDLDGFGGLVVSILASGTRVRGFKPVRSRWIFRAYEKSSACPSFGGEVIESVTCPSFAASKRT